MFPFEDSKIVSVGLSVCTLRNQPSFVHISSTLVIDASMERSSRVPNTTCKHNTLNFLFKLAKTRKNWSVMALSKAMYRGSISVHFSCSLFTMEATSPLAPAE